MHSQQTNKIQNRDVGMGLWMSLCLGVGIFLFPFFFMHWHPYIPLHFIEMIFPLVYIHIIDMLYYNMWLSRLIVWVAYRHLKMIYWRPQIWLVGVDQVKGYWSNEPSHGKLRRLKLSVCRPCRQIVYYSNVKLQQSHCYVYRYEQIIIVAEVVRYQL